MSAPEQRSRFRRRITVVPVLVLLVAAVAVVGGLGLGGRPQSAPTTRVSDATTRVTRCTLTRADSFGGSVGYGTARPMPIQASGTITWLPDPGTVVHQGQQLIRVDDRPVILLYGRIPQYRALHPPRPRPDTAAGPTSSTRDMTDGSASHREASRPLTAQHGHDVHQFTTALRHLGYRDVDPGPDYTTRTADVVRRWQADLGEQPTGSVELGDIFYAHGPVRVVPSAGAQVGTPMTPDTLTSTGRTLLVRGEADLDVSWAEVGQHVQVTSADGTVSVAGDISSTRPRVSADGRSLTAVSVRSARIGALRDQAGKVTISHVEARHVNVLCVPIAALVALAEGGYGLQPAHAAPDTYEPVHTGLFADGRVEVSGPGVDVGATVLMPEAD